MRKGRGREAKLSYMAHALMENRNGLLVDLLLTQATGTSEREAALEMLDDLERGGRVTLGADKGYDTRDFVARCREVEATPHVAQNVHARRRSALDSRTTRHAGYRVSQSIRARIESIFGWLKTVAGLRRTRHRGRERTQLAASMGGAAYNLLRMAKLMQPCSS